jgi:lambda family phage portal protein
MAKKAVTPKYKNFGRSFDAGRIGRMEDLNETRNINFDLSSSIATLRSRCRALAQNDPHITKALNSWRNNIIGNTGIDLHVQARKQNGTLDDVLNKLVEDAWWEFGKYGVSTTCGTMTFVELEKLIIESIARDGEFLAIKKFGSQFGPSGFQLDLIPIEYLSHAFNGYADNGNIIFQSIEFNRYLRPVAYWISDELINPTVTTFTQSYKQPSIRIPAEDCYHIFEKHYVGQVRGFPWIVSAVLPIHHLNSYRISELEQARIASLKQLFYTMPAGSEGMSQEDIDAAGRINTRLEPGGADILPQGVVPQVIDFNSPNSDMPDFIKAQLKAISSGLCMSYSALANDLESINFSSANYAFAELKLIDSRSLASAE